MYIFTLTGENGEIMNIKLPIWNGTLIDDTESINHYISNSVELLQYYDSNSFTLGISATDRFDGYLDAWRILARDFTTLSFVTAGTRPKEFFENIIVPTETISGEPIKWYAPNGNYVQFTQSGEFNWIYAEVYKPNGDLIVKEEELTLFTTTEPSRFYCVPPDVEYSTDDNFYCYPVTIRWTVGSDKNKYVYLTNPDTGGSSPRLNWLKKLYGDEKPQDTSDPYNGGEESSTGGGGGNYDNSSDSIDIPSLPTVSATDSGFVNLFTPNQAQIKNLANYVWSDLFEIDGWRKIFANPMDAIIGLSIVPVAPQIGGQKYVSVGNIPTSVVMAYTNKQFYEVDCGTISVKEYFGAYLDYAPYTKIEIYLPYIGTHQLDIDDVMKADVRVIYHIDILTGSCVAYVKCGRSVLYSFSGQCSSNIPINSADYTGALSSAINVACSIGSMIGTGGATAPTEISKIALSSSGVQGMKPTVQKSGTISGTSGIMGIQKPYLIITRPRQSKPKDLPKFTGYPSNIRKKLENVKGYTEVESINLSNVHCNDLERQEIISLLKSGVIL